MKLKIGTNVGGFESNRVLSTPLLVLALILIFQEEFQYVCSLPINRPPVQSGVVPSQGEWSGKERGKSAVAAAAMRPKRDIGLVGVHETAAEVIYRVNEREFALQCIYRYNKVIVQEKCAV